MQVKKYPHVVLENYSKILELLGLVLSLFVACKFIQFKSYPRAIKGLAGTLVAVDDSELILEFKPIEIEIKKT